MRSTSLKTLESVPAVLWYFWSVLATTIIAIGSLVLWYQAGTLVLIVMIMAGPLMASARLNVRQTAVVAFYATTVSVFIIAFRVQEWDWENIFRIGLVSVGSLISVWVSHLRRSKEKASSLLDSVFDSVPLGLSIYDLNLKFKEANSPMAVQLRQRATDLENKYVQDIYKDYHDMPRLVRCFEEVIKTEEPLLNEEFQTENPNDPSNPRRVLCGFFPISDNTNGKLIGVGVFSTDVSERVRVQQQLEEREAIQAATLKTALDCIITINEQGHVVEFNPAAEQTFGWSRSEALGKNMDDLIFPASAKSQGAGFRDFVQGGESSVFGQRIEIQAIDKSGREFPAELALSRLPGRPLMFTGYLRDISERKTSENELKRGVQRSKLLAEASAILNRRNDYHLTLPVVANLVVPRLADWCSIHIVEDKSIRLMAISHVDQERLELGKAVMERYPESLQAETGLAIIARDQSSMLIGDLSTVPSANSVDAARHQELGLHSVISVPIVIHDMCLGVLSFATDSASRVLTEKDLVLAEDLASRIATSVESIRAYQERDHIAKALQESLLPPTLPRLPGLEIAARYQAVGAGHEVGGDFYDAFPTGENSWIVLVGDVEGKGAEAAALTALVHYSLRTIALQEQTPAEMLAKLNEAILAQRDDGRFCTLALAKLELQDDRSIQGTMALGGHPYPLIKRSNGLVEPVGKPGLMVGITPAFNAYNEPFTLNPGDTMLLYSDGISEARKDGKMLGEKGLSELLANFPGREPEEVVDFLERKALEWQSMVALDDLALLALRVPETAPVFIKRRFPASPDSLGQIRRFVEEGVADREDVNAADVNLMVSEIASNAILYGQFDLSGDQVMVEIRLVISETKLRCSVINRGQPFEADANDPGLEADGGRGLFLVSKLASKWGKEATENGQTKVWFELELNAGMPIELESEDFDVDDFLENIDLSF